MASHTSTTQTPDDQAMVFRSAFFEDVDAILEVKDLSVAFLLADGDLQAVNHMNFALPAGKITGLVGESGSGKSTFVNAVLNMVSNPGKITGGEINYGGRDVLKLDKDSLRKFRWDQVSMVFQAAQNCLNPSMTIQEQFTETIFAHHKNMSQDEIEALSADLMHQVRLDPDRVLDSHPHQLSGGMKQRVMIAFAQLLSPPIIMLDEPTTALDVITQDHIFGLLREMHVDTHNTMLLSTHDIAIVAKICDYLAVMYGGSIVEMGDIFTMFERPAHPYTKMLIQAAPSLIGELQERVAIPGSAPDMLQEHQGCIFKDRCPYAVKKCQVQSPAFEKHDHEHYVACFRASDVQSEAIHG